MHPGFTDIQRWQLMRSDDPNFTGIESHQKIVDNEVNVFESIILQGVKR